MTTSLDAARSRLGYIECPPGADHGYCRYSRHRIPPRDKNHTEFGEAYGFNGVPWCAEFVSWCMAQAGLGDLYHFAAVASSIAWAKRAGRWHSASITPKPGWAACKLYTPTTGHTGLVEGMDGGYVVSIDGNTSGGDDRNGGIVMRRKRARSFWLGFIELPLGTPAPPASDTWDDVFVPILASNGG